MTIDLLPTIARLVGADLPAHEIDGHDVWPLLAGEPGAKNPHEAYVFYYGQNELQAVTSGDGRWKLQLPHTYRTLAGRPGGRDGTPAKYEKRTSTPRALRPGGRRRRDEGRRRATTPRWSSVCWPSPSGPATTSATRSRAARARAYAPRGNSDGPPGEPRTH